MYLIHNFIKVKWQRRNYTFCSPLVPYVHSKLWKFREFALAENVQRHCLVFDHGTTAGCYSVTHIYKALNLKTD